MMSFFTLSQQYFHIYSLSDVFPNILLEDAYDESIITLMRFLKNWIQKKNLLQKDTHQKQSNFRSLLIKLERENMFLKIENSSLKIFNDQQKETITSLEANISKIECHIDTLIYKLNNANDIIRNMHQELKNRDMRLKQHIIDKQKVIQKYNNKLEIEISKMMKKSETKLREQRKQLESEIKQKNTKLNLIQQILVSDYENSLDNILEKSINSKIAPAAIITPINTTDTTKIQSKIESDKTRLNKLNKRDKIPVVNPKYRQLQSRNIWIDHRPINLVPVGTILQPQMLCKRYVTKLTNPKAFTVKDAGYCLFAQEQDTDGELETKLYKADVLPTCGGGAQIVFSDIECLKQVSPLK